MSQFARPTTDSVDGLWTDQAGGTSLFGVIDEATADIADYIQSGDMPATADTVTIKVGSLTDPVSSTGHIVRYKMGKIGSGTLNLTARLKQGGATIAEWAHAGIASGPTDVVQTLTGPQADAITDYTDLYLEFAAIDGGPAFLIRDTFTTSVNPVVDGAADTGPGTRDATGSLWKIINGRLRGGMQPTSPTWGSSKIVYDGQARADGLTLWTIVTPANKDATLGVGWASATAVTDPTTTGHHWLMNQGYGRVSQPGTQITLTGLNSDEIGMFRATEYLVGVTLRAQGAFYWMSAVAATPGAVTGAFTRDRIGIPAYPSARVLWVEDTTTTTPMYPHVGALNAIGHVDGHVIDDLRVAAITDWASDAGMAAGLDRMTRADSTTSMGSGWTNLRNTWGVSGNKGYQAAYASPHGLATKNFGLTGDGIWQCRVTAPTTITDQFGLAFRITDVDNYVVIHNNGTSSSLFMKKFVAGVETTLNSTAQSWVAGQTYTITIIAVGNQYQVFIDGVQKFQWTTDAGNNNLTGTGMGPYAFTTAAGARWDDFMCVPHTITLPATIQTGTAPAQFTAGATIMKDTFTGADGAAINGRTPDTTGAGTWTTVGTGWEINTNRARNTNVGGSSAYFAWYDCGTPNTEITIDYLTPTGACTGVLLRYTDTSNFVTARVLGANGPSNEIEIVEGLGAPGIIVKHQYLGNFHLTGTTYTMTCQLVGDVLHVLVNGMPIITYIVHVPSSNKHGLYHSDIDTTILFDQITIKALT